MISILTSYPSIPPPYLVMPISPLPTLIHTHLAPSYPPFSTRPDDLLTPPHLHTHPHSPMLTSRCRVHTPPLDQTTCPPQPTYTPTHTPPHSPHVAASTLLHPTRQSCAWHSYFALRISPCPFHHVPESSRFPSPLHMVDMCAYSRACARAWHPYPSHVP